MTEKDFKHGDKVTCTIKGVKVTDAKISINPDGSMYICQNEHAGSAPLSKLGYRYGWNIYDSRRFGTFEFQLKHESINVTNLKCVSKDDIFAKKVTKVTQPASTKATVTAQVKKETVKTDEEFHTMKPTEDLPVFSSDLDSDTRDLLKRKAPRI